MPKANNPTLGTVACPDCHSRADVKQAKGNRHRYLYMVCPECGPDQRTGRAVQTRLWVQTAWRDGCQPVDVPPNVVLSSGSGTGLEPVAEPSTNLKVEPVTELVAEPVGEPSTDGVEPVTLTEPKPVKKKAEKPAEPSSGNGLAVAAVLLAPLLIILKGGI